MATPDQLAANRLNATHSTGPVTEAGKQISSRNALTHGLTSKALIAPGENSADFEALRRDTLTALAPQNEYERTLAENVCATLWRYRRIQRYETAFWELQITMVQEADQQEGEPSPEPDAVAARMFADTHEHRSVSLIHRYLTAAERACTRATTAYEKARDSRPQPDGPSAPKSLDDMSDAEFMAFMDSIEIPGIPSMRPIRTSGSSVVGPSDQAPATHSLASAAAPSTPVTDSRMSVVGANPALAFSVAEHRAASNPILHAPAVAAAGNPTPLSVASQSCMSGAPDSTAAPSAADDTHPSFDPPATLASTATFRSPVGPTSAIPSAARIGFVSQKSRAARRTEQRELRKAANHALPHHQEAA